MTPPVTPVAEMEINRKRRACLGRYALHLELRGHDAWIMEQAIPYEEIRAIYLYEARDWPFLLPAALAWAAAAALLLLLGLLLPGTAWLRNPALASVTVLALAVSAYRVLKVPRALLRIEAGSRRLTLPLTHPTFFESLSQRIHG